MEKELAVFDTELARTATSPESAEIFIKYEDLRKKLDIEMENWTRYSHDVDEFLKNNE
jgi:hypothetical protein